MSPPELSGDTPVTDVIKPVIINLIHSFRNKFYLAGFNNLASTSCHLIHLYKPLRFDEWLNCCSASVVCSYLMSMRYYLYQKTLSLKILQHCLTCLISVHTMISCFRTIDSSIIIHDIYLFKVMSLTNLKVVRVVSRCNLNASCSELLINI